DPEARGGIFQQRLGAFRRLLGETYPAIAGEWGELAGADLVPKPWADGVPLLVSGNSRQTLEWITKHSDGWVTYPRPLEAQQRVVSGWRAACAQVRPEEF